MVLQHVSNVVGFLNTSTVFSGIMLLLLNVGSRFIVHELSHDDNEYSQNLLLRRLTIFAVCFVGTKDLVTSLILTAAFVILSAGLFRGKGPFSREGMVTGAEKVAVSVAANNPFEGSASSQEPSLFGK
jgi:hypothetical protein